MGAVLIEVFIQMMIKEMVIKKMKINIEDDDKEDDDKKKKKKMKKLVRVSGGGLYQGSRNRFKPTFDLDLNFHH